MHAPERDDKFPLLSAAPGDLLTDPHPCHVTNKQEHTKLTHTVP